MVTGAFIAGGTTGPAQGHTEAVVSADTIERESRIGKAPRELASQRLTEHARYRFE
jgi:hypothetical protein